MPTLLAVDGFRDPSSQCPFVATVRTGLVFSFADPVVTSSRPRRGPPTGGTLVTIVGQGFGTQGVGAAPRVLLQALLGPTRVVELPLVVRAYNDRCVCVTAQIKLPTFLRLRSTPNPAPRAVRLRLELRNVVTGEGERDREGRVVVGD